MSSRNNTRKTAIIVPENCMRRWRQAGILRGPRAATLAIVAGAMLRATLFCQVVAFSPGQSGDSRPSAEAAMRQHYDAAYRLQAGGDLPRADREHTLFLAMALHHLANARANIGEYSQAVPLYEEAIRLAPDDVDTQFDFAKAAMDAEDPEKARSLTDGALNSRLEMSKARRAWFLRIQGEALRGLGQQAGAIDQFKAAAALDPDFDNIYALGNAYLWVGDKSDGSAVFAHILSTFGDTATVRMSLGRGYAEANYLPEAISEFRKAIEENSRLKGVHYSLGACYMSLSGPAAYPQAEAEFRSELAIDPDDSFSYPQLGKIALARQEYREAEADLARATARNPNNPDNYLLLAELYSETRRVPDAIAALRKAIALNRDVSRNHYAIHGAHFQLGRLLIANGEAAEGKRELQIAEDLLSEGDQQDRNTLNGKPQVQLPLETTRIPTLADKAAEEAYEKSVAPLVAGSYNNLGVHAAMRGEYAGASASFERAEEWNPALSGVDSNWGRAAFAAQEYAEAAVPLRRVLQTHPDDREARVDLSVSDYLTGNYPEAVQTLEPIEASLTGAAPLALVYADSLVKAGDVGQGMARLAILEETNPNDAKVHRALGEGFAGEGKYQQAIDELRTAVRINSFDAAAQYDLAANLIMLGETNEADSELMALAQSGSPDARVYYRLGQLRLERGDKAEAIRYLEAASRMSPGNGAIHFALAEAYHRNAQLPDARREAQLCQALAWRPPEDSSVQGHGRAAVRAAASGSSPL